MGDLDKYFEDSKPEETHPKVRSWRKLIENGNKATCELYRKFDGLTYGIAKLYVSFYDANGMEVRHDEVEWEPELNEALLRLRVASVSGENEARRLGLMLKTWFGRPEQRYGDGFFSGVLHEYLGSSELASRAPVREVLNQWREDHASRESSAYADCVDSIEAVIVEAAHSLTVLGYQRDAAKEILAAGIGHYLDERLSLTQRRMLGFR